VREAFKKIEGHDSEIVFTDGSGVSSNSGPSSGLSTNGGSSGVLATSDVRATGAASSAADRSARNVNENVNDADHDACSTDAR
jgi:hypothetical protein